MKSLTVIRKYYYHYANNDGEGGQHFNCLINMNKMRRLRRNEYHDKFISWTKDVLIDDNVPHDLFKKGVERCSGFDYDSKDLPILVRNSRYSSLILSALKNRKDREKHYVVQKYLIENPITNMVISEIPIWSLRPRVGHMDLISFEEGAPSIVIWDYKPNLLGNEKTGLGQIQLYQVMLAKLIEIPVTEISCGTFDDKAEVILVR